MPSVVVSRRKKGSRNRARARVRLARVHQHVANQRTDFLHKLTTKMVKQHAAICTEDLSVKGLARTKLAKSVQDAGMGTLLWQLAYKGQWYGTQVVAVDRLYPSTRLCHDCGFKNDALTLADCTWVCPACGVLHDRDLNAALNIRDEGLRILAVGYPESLNTWAPGSVSGLVVQDTPQVEEAPIAPGKERRADADPASEQVPAGSEVADRARREITLGDYMR